MSDARTTTDHEEIRRWVEERGGRPATVKATGGADDPGILRIDYPNRGDDSALEEIDWEAFFQAFEDNGLAFLHQDRTADGKLSRFSKFVARRT
jgi:hypothetical protein